MDTGASDTPKPGDMDTSEASFEITKEVLQELIDYLFGLYHVAEQSDNDEWRRAIHLLETCVRADKSTTLPAIKEWYLQQTSHGVYDWEMACKSKATHLNLDGMKMLVKQLCEAALTLPLEKIGCDPYVKYTQGHLRHLRNRCDDDLSPSRLRDPDGGGEVSKD